MKKTLVLVLAFAMLASTLLGCTAAPAEPADAAPAAPATEATTADGAPAEAAVSADPYTGIAYDTDTEFDYLYAEEITSLNYLTTSSSVNQKSLANFIDTLVDYDSLGNMIPCIAESWESSEDGLTWTFHLRQGVKWFTCDGEEYAELTANDFVYAAQLITDPAFGSDVADMLNGYIVNAAELYNGVITDKSLLGVKAVDDYTLVYELKAPCAYFLTLLTYGCYLPVNAEFYESLNVENPEPVILDDGTEELVTNEFGTDRDKILYCGAYLCENWMPQEEFVWAKNENYWDADKVFITKINGRFNEQADSIAPEMFLRGELDQCKVTTNILDDWMNSDNKNIVHPTKRTGTMMTMLFDFNSNLRDEQQNAQYKVAVNNKNFRLAIAHALNKTYTTSPFDPYNEGAVVANLMVPANFAVVNGKDYVTFGNLPELAKGMYDEEKAKAFRDTAKEELAAAGIQFPIEIPVFYNPSAVNTDQAWLLVEKNLEDVLGNDFINLTVSAGPATNFISEVRRPGIWGLYEEGWSPDFADPMTYFDPFGYGWSYGWQEYIEDDYYKTGYIYTEEDYKNLLIDDEELIGKPQMKFNALVEEARQETDLEKRYELFAKAEQFAIEEALLIPYRQFNDGYVASKLSPFDFADSMAGISSYRYKGVHLLEKSYSVEEFNAAQEAWLAAKAAQ